MNKIAIVRRNGLGDLLCTFPLIRHLKEKDPSVKITLFVDERNAPLLPYLESVEEVVIFPGKGNKYLNAYLTARKYRDEFDLAISAKTSPMKLVNFFLYWMRAKKRIAYVDTHWHSRLINSPIAFDFEKSSQMHQALKCLKTVAPEIETISPSLFPRLSIPSEIKNNYSLKPVGLPQVLISATITKEKSRLNPNIYANLLHRLYDVAPFHARIVGQSQDRERANMIKENLQIPCSIHFPRNFEAFMVLLDSCDLYFVGDGGVAHIGAALSKKEVVLFGETNPVEWGPLNQDAEVFYHPVHVDKLSEHEIFQALKRKLKEVIDCGRNNH